MKNCPQCNAQLQDDAVFCYQCGAQFAQQQPQYQPPYQPQPPYQAQPVYTDPADHTAEFDPVDISENKVISMLVYLLGWVGIVIALLAAQNSKYAAFHVRQALKFVVVETLIPICLGVGVIINIIPILGWIVYGLAALALSVMLIVLQVIKIICFFSICSGKAKEPAIIRGLKFMK